MGLSRVDGDLNVIGNLSASTVSFPALGIVNADVSASAAIAASKTQTYVSKIYVQDDGTDIAAATSPIHLVRGAGSGCCTILSLDVCCIDAPSASNEGFTVDLKMGGVSVLSAVVTYTADRSDLDVMEGTITDASHDHDDLLVIEVAALGATGTKGQGLHVELRMTETYPA